VNALAERSYDILAFAPRRARSLGNAATTQHADVFARQERYPIVSVTCEPARIAGILGEQIVVLTSAGFDAVLPSWAPHVFRSLVERWGVKEGWDSYNAKPTDMQHVVKLLNYLTLVMHEDSTSPIITPLTDGGVQAEWHGNNERLEIVAPADEVSTYYHYDACTGQEEEAPLDPSVARLRDLIAHFR
jgi:hypothetical protein